jgi:type IV pilus assembly protein PilB
MKASDIHLEPLSYHLRLRYRIDGVLVHRTDFPKEMEAKIISRIKVLAKADIAEHRHHQDGRFQLEIDGQEVDIRVSIYITVDGENVVMRVLNRGAGLMALEEIGLSPMQLQHYTDRVLRASSGIVIITGPTGSGKTSSLYSSIDWLNGMDVKIITAEDPVEY